MDTSSQSTSGNAGCVKDKIPNLSIEDVCGAVGGVGGRIRIRINEGDSGKTSRSFEGRHALDHAHHIRHII